MVTSFKLNSQIFDQISAIDIFPFHLIFNLQEFIQALTDISDFVLEVINGVKSPYKRK